MPVDEHSRHALHLKLEESLGAQEATTLMEHLPPVGWADVATKRDIEHLAVATKRDIDHFAETLEIRLLAQFRSELMAQTRTFVLSLMGTFLTSTGVAVALARAL